MKILTILGARPQFIKASSVSRAFLKYENIKEVIVHTGQHYDSNMSDIFFEQLKIPKPTYFLGIGGNTHGAMTGQMMEKIEGIAQNELPNWIMVYGDTNSTLAGALVAAKLHIKLIHIEAGLRSFNMKMPEEVNRILTDRISNLLFCPTKSAVENLKDEGFKNFPCIIKNVGDVMQDGINYYKNFSVKPESISDSYSDYVLCTLHRAENTDDNQRLYNIFNALTMVSHDVKIILPLHPRTKKIIKNLGVDTTNITIIDPVGYLEMVWLITNCRLVMTDSGGLQKEAYFLQKPCITLRDETEWVELIQAGVNRLVGADIIKIKHAYDFFIQNNIDFPNGLYGNNSALTIVEEIVNYNCMDRL